MDNACNNHMTGNKEIFRKLNSNFTSILKFRDKIPLKIAKKKKKEDLDT